MEELERVIEEIDALTRSNRRFFRAHRKKVAKRFDEMDAAYAAMKQNADDMQQSVQGMQQSIEGLQQSVQSMQRSIGGMQQSLGALTRSGHTVRADLDELEAHFEEKDSLRAEQLGRVARATNILTDGYETRFKQIEARLDRLEKKSA